VSEMPVIKQENKGRYKSRGDIKRYSRIDSICFDLVNCFKIFIRNYDEKEEVYCHKLWNYYYRANFDNVLKLDVEELIQDYLKTNEKRMKPIENENIYDVFSDIIYLELRITPQDKQYKKLLNRLDDFLKDEKIKSSIKLSLYLKGKKQG